MNDILSPPNAGAANAVGRGEVIKLVVHGFGQIEQKMLHAIVQLSQRRNPRIELLPADDGMNADIVMIDAADSTSTQWVENHPWLNTKAVIWVDALYAAEGSTMLKRPVHWSELPGLLTRALENSQTQPAKSLSAPPVHSEQASVLVVDDSLAVRSMLCSMLSARGLKVTDVSNADDALKLVAAAPFSLVLLDVLMPGMDGYEACRKIKTRSFGGVPPAVIILTSRSSSFDKIKGKMAGADAYLTKPVDPEHLTEVIRGFISQSAHGEGPQHLEQVQRM